MENLKAIIKKLESLKTYKRASTLLTEFCDKNSDYQANFCGVNLYSGHDTIEIYDRTQKRIFIKTYEKGLIYFLTITEKRGGKRPNSGPKKKDKSELIRISFVLHKSLASKAKELIKELKK